MSMLPSQKSNTDVEEVAEYLLAKKLRAVQLLLHDPSHGFDHPERTDPAIIEGFPESLSVCLVHSSWWSVEAHH